MCVRVPLLQRDADEKLMAFDGRPYLRLLVGLASELGSIVGEDGSEGGGLKKVSSVLAFSVCKGCVTSKQAYISSQLPWERSHFVLQ